MYVAAGAVTASSSVTATVSNAARVSLRRRLTALLHMELPLKGVLGDIITSPINHRLPSFLELAATTVATGAGRHRRRAASGRDLGGVRTLIPEPASCANDTRAPAFTPTLNPKP